MHQGQTSYGKIVSGIFVIGVLLMSVVGWILWDSHRTVWSHATETSTNLVTALQRDVHRTIETYDLSLQAAVRGLQAPELAELSPATRHQLLFDGAIEATHMGSVSVLDTTGRIVEDSAQLVPREGSFADRDFFTVQRDKGNAGLFISKPFKSHLTNEWSIAISRRVTGPQGQFAGVVVGSIRFSYFRDLFSKLDLGPGGTISLFNLDGTMLYRSPFQASLIGRDFSKASIFQEIEAGRTAPYRNIAKTDGVARLFAFSIVDGLPLVVSVNTAISTVYAGWMGKAVLSCSMSLMLLAAAALLLRMARSQQRQVAAAEQTTAQSTKLLEAFYDHCPDALFVVGVAPDGRLTYRSYNRACAVLTGLTPDEVIGKEPREVFEPEVAEAIERRYRTCIDSGRTYDYQETRMLPAGRRDWHAVLCPIRDEQGVVTLMLGSARDMTEQNSRAAELHQMTKMEAVGRLTAGVAHDFNNYLQTITGSLEILNTDFLSDPEAVEYGEIARKAASSGAKLTHRLLAFSRQQVLRPQRINVATLLGDTRKLAGSAGFGPGIHFKINVEPFTDDIRVDPVQAESCLLNLLFNARDAMPDGGNLMLQARNACASDGVCGKLAPENVVIIAVHDSGCGMDEATRAKAFEPFFTTKAFGKGSGLGLSMAQGFCHQSGGEIRILSGGRVGTRIELWLPAMAAGATAGEEITSNIASMGRTTGRILLVEDEHDVSMALAGSLVSGGFEVVAVTCGRDGLMRLHDREPYDAVLTDYAMPDMAGSDFLARVATEAPNLPLLMLSGSNVDEAVLAAVGRRVTLLKKPILRTDLLFAVREAIGDTRWPPERGLAIGPWQAAFGRDNVSMSG